MVALNEKNIKKYGKDEKLLTDLKDLIYIKKPQIKHNEILECLNVSGLDDTIKYVMVNAYAEFYKHYTKRNSSVLMKYKDDIIKNSIDKPLILDNKNYDFYSYEELTSILATLYGTDYMILYLFFKLGVRNTDIIATFNDTHDETKNYFIFENDKLYFIRNVYKNSKKYGKLTIEIEDDNFKQCIKDTPINAFIFLNTNGKPYDEITIALKLKRILYINGIKLFNKKIIMSQSSIFEVIEDHFKYNVEELTKLYKQRPLFDKLNKFKTT